MASELQSPAKFGDKGNVGGGPQPAGGKLVSPVKDSNKSEASGHDNGPKG